MNFNPHQKCCLVILCCATCAKSTELNISGMQILSILPGDEVVLDPRWGFPCERRLVVEVDLKWVKGEWKGL